MLKNRKELTPFAEAVTLFNQIFMKYEVARRKPVAVGEGEKLHVAQVHMIEAIGKGHGNTVTALSDHFKVTKGAVCHIITKLYKLDYIVKIKKEGNDKEIMLELTPKGWKVFQCHEESLKLPISEMLKIGNGYSEQEIQAFLSILRDIAGAISSF